MLYGLVGVKKGMTQIFKGDGRVVPVTVIQAGPCYVTQIKTPEKDGYSAVQLGFLPAKKVNKPMEGHFKKAGVPPMKILREVEADDVSQLKLGQEIKVSDVFKEGEYVDVSGIAKGKDFMGVVKRWGFGGGPASHGSSLFHRRPGSIGSTTDPGRVWKGKKMPGRESKKKVTVQNLVIEKIYPEDNVILVRGAVPGPRGGVVLVRKAKKKVGHGG